jgi:hypothetical protein
MKWQLFYRGVLPFVTFSAFLFFFGQSINFTKIFNDKPSFKPVLAVTIYPSIFPSSQAVSNEFLKSR